jgi:hypothetical protein
MSVIYSKREELCLDFAKKVLYEQATKNTF